VGFDDFELAAILNPTLTVVRQPSQELGSAAATLLFNRLNGPAEIPAVGERVVLPVELVVRRSCGCGASAAIDRGSISAKPLHRAAIEACPGVSGS
jgi:hypothetical protein